MKNFNKLYWSILNTKNKEYTPYIGLFPLEKPIILENTTYSLNKLKFLISKDADNIPSIFEKTNIIKENKITYGPLLLKKLFQSNGFFDVISKKYILKYLSPNWEYYQKFKQTPEKPLYIFKIDFFNPFNTYPDKGFYKIIEKFNISIKELENNFSEKQIIENYNIFFKNILGPGNGATIDFYLDNLICIFLNSNNCSLTTMSHELTHYMQFVLNIDLLEINIIQTSIKSLGLTEDQVKYLFSKEQFLPHIKSDLCITLKKLLNIFNRNRPKNIQISKQNFLEHVFDDIEKDPQNVMTSNIGIMWSQFFSNDSAPLRLFAATIILQRSDLTEKIKNYLKQYFN